MHKFKVGDIVNSSLSSPKQIIDIRLGVPADFAGKCVNWTGKLCYVLQYLDGKRLVTVYSIEAVENDHHLKGSEMFDCYEAIREEIRS